MTYKTSGIVLKGTNFGEADRILTILTERFGKIKAIAKGVRKIKSHLGGSLEPFMLVDLQVHQGKTFYVVTGAAIIEQFSNIHGNLAKTAKAFFLGELIDKFMVEDHLVPEIYGIFLQAMNSLENDSPGLIIKAFELKIIEAAGFKPELHYCLHCKEKIRVGQNFWDNIEGGVICGKCQRKTYHGREITDETVKLFRFLEEENFDKISRLKLPEITEEEADEILHQYIENILERDLKSERFLKML